MQKAIYTQVKATKLYNKKHFIIEPAVAAAADSASRRPNKLSAMKAINGLTSAAIAWMLLARPEPCWKPGSKQNAP